MLQCTSCGFCFTRPARGREFRGEHFGFPASEAVGCCPRCGGAYVEHTAGKGGSCQ